MKILILRSTKNKAARDQYSVCMDTSYAERFISHLSDKKSYCSSCGDECIACRSKYHLDFSENIAGIIDFPAILPVMVDEPQEFFPADVPPHDILVAIAVNEEILISFIETFSIAKGIIVPIERSDWISPFAITKIKEICKKNGVAVSFPKPFCAFNPTDGILKEFQKQFHLGKPEIKFSIKNHTIDKAEVCVSAPCGATYFTARGLTKKRVDDDLKFIIDKQLSCYPCTADTAVDKEFGDSITHQAVKIQRDILLGLLNVRKK